MKKPSTWILFVALSLAASQMHPGFATLFVIGVLLILLMLLRLTSHREGAQMLRDSQKNGHDARWPLARELAITVAIGVVFMAGLWQLVRHVPWLWMSTAVN